MLQNGNLTALRVIASSLIGLVSVAGGIYLLAHGIEIPNQYWMLAAVSIFGVVGVDVAAAILGTIKPKGE